MNINLKDNEIKIIFFFWYKSIKDAIQGLIVGSYTWVYMRFFFIISFIWNKVQVLMQRKLILQKSDKWTCVLSSKSKSLMNDQWGEKIIWFGFSDSTKSMKMILLPEILKWTYTYCSVWGGWVVKKVTIKSS